jgi:hypothetical protein
VGGVCAKEDVVTKNCEAQISCKINILYFAKRILVAPEYYFCVFDVSGSRCPRGGDYGLAKSNLEQ